MARRFSFLFLLVAIACTQNVDFVDPFIGTDFNGHTSPGACYPLGYVQAGPTTGLRGWDYCSGYRNNDTLMLGFTQTRLSGTGCADLGDLLVMPFSSAVRENYASLMDKSPEHRWGWPRKMGSRASQPSNYNYSHKLRHYCY